MSCNILRRSYDEDYDVCLFAINKDLAEAYYLSAFRADDGSIDVVITHYKGNIASSTLIWTLLEAMYLSTVSETIFGISSWRAL